ncbi:SDR family oxidoreductase [Sphingobium algorifonticola]|uniref:SDR family oxidoreductase n=1 Tax=Sphingobium algorifonticola TaxID=2008318 RepID=A0A437JC56_9SPHN|nr:SDR family oxidoreductase [Sphingobium algorifonticola]RVT43461.1 SDR family oxidoreductase [Sphingobium algorifonticola]
MYKGMQPLTDSVAIVTGGAKGFGLGIAKALHGRGARVYITGRDEAALARAADGTGLIAVKADATSGADWDALIKQVVDEAGRLDILINNAGGGGRILAIGELTDEDIESVVSQNFVAPLLGCRRIAPLLAAQKSGTIINVSSVAAHQAWPCWGLYGGAKAGLAHFSKALYGELREQGVRVTTFTPSWGATEFDGAAGLPARDADTVARCIQPEEIGEMIADICALPAHLWVQETILWPMVQEVVPL